MTEEQEARIAEYVLGTLPSGERAAFERDLAADPALKAGVAAWERRLAGLAAQVPPVEPGPQVWAALERAIGPEAPPKPAAAAVLRLSAEARLLRSRAWWRSAALVAGALAAGLVAFILLPRAELPARPDSYVAVVNRGGDLPALIVRVDTRAGVVQVRPVRAEVPADRSLELWFVAAGAAPRSLGLIDAADRKRLAIPEALRGSALVGSTLAVSVEPAGGSPTGAPTGPVVYSGTLIDDPS
ncbi:anti-sigma-K factor RskA [Inquilinus ginsengisoli]|uniref:anti-sigma factor n=1 Tax=Inquilinus ginsengisoli TaxID=363840 RepID=UPI003D2256F9